MCPKAPVDGRYRYSKLCIALVAYFVHLKPSETAVSSTLATGECLRYEEYYPWTRKRYELDSVFRTCNIINLSRKERGNRRDSQDLLYWTKKHLQLQKQRDPH